MAQVEPIVFFGTPQFAVPTLDALERAGRRPVAVVTQPSRRSGRGRKTEAPPVLRWAESHSVEVVQPPSVKKRLFRQWLSDYAPALAIVVAFGQIFPRSLLEIPSLGCMNLHGSLLPAYRGASPIAAAILAGETVTGVSTMWMEAGLDSGPVLLERSVEIGPTETTAELSERLATVGADLVVETVERLEQGTIEPRPQDDALATFAPLLKKADGQVEWRRTSTEIFNQVRALDPWPGTWTEFRQQPLRVVQAALPPAGAEPLAVGSLIAGADGDESAENIDARSWAGRFLGRQGDAILVGCGEGTALRLEKVQRPGRKAVRGADFVNAERPRQGEVFGQ